MAAGEITWPSMVAAQRRQNDAANQLTPEPRTPTWPASLPKPSHSAPSQPQPNLYLQLSQILEWEIWNHNQTRAGLHAERVRRTELEAEVWKLSQAIGQWQATHQAACATVEDHQVENESLRADLEAMKHRIRQLQEQQQLPEVRECL